MSLYRIKSERVRSTLGLADSVTEKQAESASTPSAAGSLWSDHQSWCYTRWHRDWHKISIIYIPSYFVLSSFKNMKHFVNLHVLAQRPCSSLNYSNFSICAEASTTPSFNVFILPRLARCGLGPFWSQSCRIRARVSYPDGSENLTSPQTSYKSIRVLILILQMGKLR